MWDPNDKHVLMGAFFTHLGRVTYCFAKPPSSPMEFYNQLETQWYISEQINALTHWGRMTHVCVGKLTLIGSDNSLSPERRQAIIWTNARILLIGPLGTNFSGILIEIHTFSMKKMRLKMSSAKCCSFCHGLNVLTILDDILLSRWILRWHWDAFFQTGRIKWWNYRKKKTFLHKVKILIL